MKTKHKIYLASIIYFFINPFIRKKIHKRNGINWNLDLSEGIDLSIFLFGNSEKKINNTKHIFKQNKKITIIDIGANIGSVSLILAKIFNKSKIYSIEPTNYAYKKLIKNLNLNKDLKKNIIPKQLFITKKRKPKKVYSSWDFNSFKNKHPVHLGKLQKVKLKSHISLTNFIKKMKIKSLDFIKLDVDGYELDVLQSGEGFLRKFKPTIFLEIAPYLYPEHGYQCQTLINYIKKIGYSFYDDDLKKISNINSTIKNIATGSSRNFYLRDQKSKTL